MTALLMRHYTGALEALVRIAGHAEEEGRVHAVRSLANRGVLVDGALSYCCMRPEATSV